MRNRDLPAPLRVMLNIVACFAWILANLSRELTERPPPQRRP